jgi:methionine-S-sulfoxide reductase
LNELFRHPILRITPNRRIVSTKTATLAAGCFWGVEEAFRTLSGVISTEVGYTGGHTESPTYIDVCTDTTGHAESVQITFDPEVVSYRDILTRFFKVHDATQVNRQGPDVGSQYRSAIFYHNDDQEREARLLMSEVEQEKGVKLATELAPASVWHPAEEYHQKYFLKNGGGTCHI